MEQHATLFWRYHNSDSTYEKRHLIITALNRVISSRKQKYWLSLHSTVIVCCRTKWCLHSFDMLTNFLGSNENGWTCSNILWQKLSKFLRDSILSHNHECVIGRRCKGKDSGRGVSDGWRGRIVSELLPLWGIILNFVEKIFMSAIGDRRVPGQCDTGIGSCCRQI